MKILVFAEVYYPDIMGGGEYSTKQMTESLAGRGHEIVVYCLGADTCEEEINGVLVKRRYLKGLSGHFLSLAKNSPVTDTFTRLDKIRRKWGDLYHSRRWYECYRTIIMKEAPDAVHTASPMSYLGRLNLWRAAYDLGIPVSHVCRGPNLLVLSFPPAVLDGYNRRRNAKASFFLTALAAPSRFMLDRHNRAGIRGQKFNEVIYNAVDFEPASLTKELMGRKEDMILYAGELSEKKGISTLIQATEGFEGISLVIIGSGEKGCRIRSGGNVTVLDWMDREALYAYMQKAKAVVLPSKWDEPFGRILIEAVYSGTIAMGSDRGAIPEVLGFDERYIFRSGDATGLTERIQRVLGLSSLQYTEEVREQLRVMARFSDRDYGANWERFFLRQTGTI